MITYILYKNGRVKQKTKNGKKKRKSCKANKQL